jgi:hypothetical protein
MKQEVNPLFLIGGVVLVVVITAILFWKTGQPTPVTTDKPTKPNPPGGMIRVQ